jgi:hypothetical protein
MALEIGDNTASYRDGNWQVNYEGHPRRANTGTHGATEGRNQERISFLFHGVHHQYPNDKKRLVMPTPLS